MDFLASIDTPMLLVSGTKSPAYLRQSIRKLADILPQKQYIELDGLDYSGSWNGSRGGNPGVVAAALQDFFS